MFINRESINPIRRLPNEKEMLEVQAGVQSETWQDRKAVRGFLDAQTVSQVDDEETRGNLYL